MTETSKEAAKAAFDAWKKSPTQRQRDQLREALIAAGHPPEGHGVIAKAKEVFTHD